MTTEQLLSNLGKIINDEFVPYTRMEQADRRRTMKRILKRSRFDDYTNEQLDRIKVHQLNNGGYVVTDLDGKDWVI